jgi:hypothetical protein
MEIPVILAAEGRTKGMSMRSEESMRKVRKPLTMLSEWEAGLAVTVVEEGRLWGRTWSHHLWRRFQRRCQLPHCIGSLGLMVANNLTVNDLIVIRTLSEVYNPFFFSKIIS